MSLKKKLASGVLAAGLVVPASFAVASADNGPSTSTAPTTTQPAAASGNVAKGPAKREALVAEVAAKAGISTETLQNAINEVRLEHLTARLQKAVTRGRITQAQADALIAKAKAGNWPGKALREGRNSGNGNGLGLGKGRLRNK